MIYAGTGHRPDKLGGYGRDAEGKVNLFALRWLRGRTDATKVISGLAQGWDTAIAFAAMMIGIPLVAAIPFSGQESKWPAQAQARYRRILKGCVEVVVVCPGGYANAKFQTRNQWMVDNCETLVALWDGSPGGTGNCMRYAGGKPIDIINLWDQWVEFK